MRIFPLKYQFLLATALLGVSSCAYLIPENPSAPRYNIVEGDIHTPIMNNMVGKNAGASYRPPALEPDAASKPSSFMGNGAGAGAAPVSTLASESSSDTRTVPVENQSNLAAPVVPVASNAAPKPMPPVQAVAVAQPPVTAPSSPVSGVLKIPAAADQTGRKVPIENEGNPVLLAQAYPDLNSVPPRPSTEGVSHLQGVRSDLEEGHAATVKDAKQLREDAAKEPSLQGEEAPVMPPVTPPAAADSALPREPLPVPSASAGPSPIAVLQVPPASFSPPQPEVRVVVTPAIPAPEPVAVAPLLPPTHETASVAAPALLPEATASELPALEPITLRPPVQTSSIAAMAPVPALTPLPPTLAPMATASADGFDPLAGAKPSQAASMTYGGAVGYLPPSRYAQRRMVR